MYTQLKYTVLTKEKARTYLGKVGDFLHATVKSQTHSYLKYFWDERYAMLVEIHTDLVEATSGALQRPVKFSPGTAGHE